MEPAGETIRRFRAASREVVRELDLLGSGGGASPLECHLLLELERQPGCAPGALASTLRVDKAVLSRALRRLLDGGLLRSRPDVADGRRRRLGLTAAGRRQVERIHRTADARVASSLALLSDLDRRTVVEGMALYARSLRVSRARTGCTLRPVATRDDAALARLIREVGAEHGLAGAGTSMVDPEIDGISAAYRARRHAYFVIEKDGRVVGGAGVAPLRGGDRLTCELRKMYLRPEARGLGLGQQLLDRCLDAAREHRFRRCYLETMSTMADARRLYERNGFRAQCAPEGATGHGACNTWYVRELA